MNILLRVRLTWNFSIVSSEREHRFIWTSVQTINEAVLCTRLQHSTDYSHHRSEFSSKSTKRPGRSPGSGTERNDPKRRAPPAHWSARSDGCRLDCGSRTGSQSCVTHNALIGQAQSCCAPIGQVIFYIMTYLSYDPLRRVWASNGWKFSVCTCDSKSDQNLSSDGFKKSLKIYQGLHKYMKCFQHWYKWEMFLEQQISIW